jgi:hypothetical protein
MLVFLASFRQNSASVVNDVQHDCQFIGVSSVVHRAFADGAKIPGWPRAWSAAAVPLMPITCALPKLRPSAAKSATSLRSRFTEDTTAMASLRGSWLFVPRTARGRQGRCHRRRLPFSLPPTRATSAPPATFMFGIDRGDSNHLG